MNPRPLWPLLPPVAAVGIMALLLWLTNWLSGKGADCFIYHSTGFYCPGCGGTRCAHDLVAGNWMEALSHNALLTMVAISSAAICIYYIVRVTVLGKPSPQVPGLTTKWLWAGVTIIALFTILRNIPAWPFSLLAP